MKRLTVILCVGLLLMAAWPAKAQADYELIGWMARAGMRLMANQNLRMTDSPTFAGLTLTGTTFTVNGSSGILDDGTVPLTADWPMGAFNLSQATWQGVAIGVGYGGTGLASYAVGDLLYASGATALSKLAAVAAGQVLVSAGTTTAPAYSASPSVTNILVGDGLVDTPSVAAASNTDTGMYFSTGTYLMQFAIDGVNKFLIGSAQCRIDGLLNLSGNVQIGTESAGVAQFGQDLATPTDQTIKAGDGVGTDKVGAMLTFNGGQSTGTGAGGGVRIQTSTVAATGSTANTQYTRYRAVGKIVTLTDASATGVVSFAVVAGGVVGGMLVYTIDVTDDDASDRQVESGTVIFCGLQDEANWHTNISEVSTQALESGALATTWAIDTATANTLKITCLADSDLTTPVIKLRYQVFLNSPIVETPL